MMSQMSADRNVNFVLLITSKNSFEHASVAVCLKLLIIGKIPENSDLFVFFLEIWREFIAYNIDLEPTPLILPPYSTDDPLGYSVILDGNNQTCLDVTAHASCGMFLKVCILIVLE